MEADGKGTTLPIYPFSQRLCLPDNTLMKMCIVVRKSNLMIGYRIRDLHPASPFLQQPHSSNNASKRPNSVPRKRSANAAFHQKNSLVSPPYEKKG